MWSLLTGPKVITLTEWQQYPKIFTLQSLINGKSKCDHFKRLIKLTNDYIKWLSLYLKDAYGPLKGLDPEIKLS